MQVIKSLPENVVVAVSGGIDSVALMHYLRRNKKVKVAHYVHSNSKFAIEELDFVTALCKKYKLELIVGKQKNESETTSREAHWRNGRYEFFHSLPYTVCTGHTLDDLVSWYLLTCLRGEGQYMNYSNKNVVRPFLTTTKYELEEFIRTNEYEYIQDNTNLDSDFTYRNRIVNDILPHALKINSGLYKTVKNNFLRKNQNLFFI